MRTHSALPVSLLLLSAAFFGCENADSEKGVTWNGSQPSPAAPVQAASSSSSSASSSAGGSSTSTRTAAAPATSTPATSTQSGGSTAGDQVAFSSLRWSFGGVNGSGAVQSGVQIAGLSCTKNGMSFRYVKDLSAWGRAYSHAGDYACLFVQKSDGSWVGGKFDWISSSRRTRGFENIRGGYNRWSLSGVPNPCKVAFVILNHDCRRRSNVIAGTWSR